MGKRNDYKLILNFDKTKPILNMAISDETIDLIELSLEYVTEQDLIIPDDEKKKFWKWFQTNADYYEPKSMESLQETKFSGRCFDIAQKTNKHQNIDYVEGFVELSGEAVFHGFNLENDKVADYTAKKHLSEYIQMNGNKLPSKYYGIKIPSDFIESQNSIYLNKDEFNIPFLLYEYFKMQIEISF